ncbi:MAG TPA: DUF488 domain-containing protein [Gemmatimonadaceae bacterium]|nr:DUF488 domain-containing protein [Gemmatimonadaceae bacterium]
MVTAKRVYEQYSSTDGFRVLVDRLWPRGIAKATGHIDLWLKDVAPSNELRAWYGHDPAKWAEFRKRYTSELRESPAKEALDELVRRARRGRVTLVYSSRVEDINNATVLEQIVNRRLKSASS